MNACGHRSLRNNALPPEQHMPSHFSFLSACVPHEQAASTADMNLLHHILSYAHACSGCRAIERGEQAGVE